MGLIRLELIHPDRSSIHRGTGNPSAELWGENLNLCLVQFPRAIRRLRSKRGGWWPQRTPQIKKRTALLRKLKEVFRHSQSQPIHRVIDQINPVLRGWVQYFAVGNASHCFSYVRNWVEQRVRRHLMRARNRRGLGWTRWSRRWLYETLGLYRDYRIRYLRAPVTALPTR